MVCGWLDTVVGALGLREEARDGIPKRSLRAAAVAARGVIVLLLYVADEVVVVAGP